VVSCGTSRTPSARIALTMVSKLGFHMTGKGHKWDRARLEKLRAAMSDPEIDALRARSETALNSLTLGEVGVLFIVTRERIRTIEAKARKKRGSE
jgi:DNA-directed RNA polymerase sigma subunit (sigma70/sigma32)